MNKALERTNKIIQEEIDRPDAVWLSLVAGGVNLEENKVMSFEEAVACRGDFGNIKGLVVTEIPLYGSEGAEGSLDAATRYIFNQIEIHEKTKENLDLLGCIGNFNG